MVFKHPSYSKHVCLRVCRVPECSNAVFLHVKRAHAIPGPLFVLPDRNPVLPPLKSAKHMVRNTPPPCGMVGWVAGLAGWLAGLAGWLAKVREIDFDIY